MSRVLAKPGTGALAMIATAAPALAAGESATAELLSELQRAPIRLGYPLVEAEVAQRRDVVLVWEDSAGRMQFIAPSEQRPFFEAMKYDQLRAQLKKDHST